MALKKAMDPRRSGNTGDYLKIYSLDIVTGYVKIAVFKDKASRAAGKEPLGYITEKFDRQLQDNTDPENPVMVNNPEFPYTITKMDVNNPIKGTYMALKARAKYSGATDD
jgi:hypothetical protein